MNLVLPTRLIDVGNIDDNMVRLVDVKKCSDGHEFTYLILSYCWGTGNETSKTTEVKLEARLEGFEVSELAKTIQDAILLTRTMGYRYLWVDAICIIQGSRGDFQSESSRMGDYYSNAECCISASAASDSSEGFLRPRPIVRYPTETFALRIANDSGDGPKHFVFRDNNNSPIFIKALLDSSLTQRGWCLQETALSKRILHWTLQGLYLECSNSLFLEGSKIPWDRSWDNEAMPRTILARPNNDHLVTHGWCQLVSIFSETDLTYETDRLYAIHGIASLLVERLKIEYFNGHFRFGLAHGLLWYHGNTKHSSFHYMRDEKPVEVSLPSWCWAFACPVQHERIRQKPIFIHDDHPKRLRQWPTRPGDTSTVVSPVSKLYIRAPIIQLVIGRKDLGYMVDESSGQQVNFECSFFLDRERDVLKKMFHHGMGEEESVLWMPVGKQLHHDTNAVVGLLIYEVSGEDKGTYRRCGVLTYVDFANEELLMDLKEITLV
ncbi:unnamed protein product [Fusarium venenatum]|uniref:Heterokaryon incompatibility domain-containing protein n=2 Tax=Fusarium venenatum TaxID=56646 RepID=A0A2L2TLM0_9HYPO|nr:uncharacterized protein FVRRES_04481 [Fusarium venenatum]CEI60045.1 unnamed protein product [Fusarium venenatum]